MRSRAVILVVAVVTALALPVPAHAKGAQRATVIGPGLDKPITFTTHDEYDGIESFVNETGFYPALFQTQPNPMVEAQPVADLGPRYRVDYTMKVPGRKASIVHQDLYPYAQPNPVTYTAPGQPTIDSTKSIGGWYVSTQSLLTLLISRGLPRAPVNAPATAPGASAPPAAAAPVAPAPHDTPGDSGSGTRWVVVAAMSLIVAAGLLTARTARSHRSRPLADS